jgi:hypothetical protein
MQRTELLDDQEQENHDRASGVQQVLQALPQAHASQRGEVERFLAVGFWQKSETREREANC